MVTILSFPWKLSQQMDGNAGTIPMKLLLHLTTVFQPGGLRNRTGSVLYKEGLQKCQVPVLAIAGDHDMICPPPAVIGNL
jgi:pimeloyl-ACP methyl ester carboxylesterase